MKQRFWEIDTLRGVAIVMMVIYHFLWNLYFFGYVSFATLISPFWKYFQRYIACSFILLVGVALVVSHHAARQKIESGKAKSKKAANAPASRRALWQDMDRLGLIVGPICSVLVALIATPLQRTIAITYLAIIGLTWVTERFGGATANSVSGFRKSLWRGLNVFGWGMVVTTSVAIGQTGSVDFGVLHLIGFSIIASYPFLNFRWINVGLWLLFNIGGYYLLPDRAEQGNLWLVWLGWRPPAYGAVDYFPIIPWFGVVLLGIAIGNFVYGSGKRAFSLPDLSAWFPPNILQWLGKRSLFIYVIHQPIMFGLLTVLRVAGLL